LATLLSLLGGCNKIGGNNTDALLDKYEEIVDKTISVNAKIKVGDYSAMSEMSELNVKYQELGTKLEKARGEGMSQAQIARFQKIVNKLSNSIR